jgi:anti-sigma B factor antagonist
MTHLEEVSVGQCWSGFGLTLTITKADALRANMRLAGQLDLASARLLEAALEHQLDCGRRYLRLDLSGLAFFDAAGLAAILEAHQAFLDRRGTLILTGAGRRVRRLVELAELQDVLFIAGDMIEVPSAIPVA